MKDHEIAEVVNQLTDIARQCGTAQQLRQRISQYIVPILKPPAVPKQFSYIGRFSMPLDSDPTTLLHNVAMLSGGTIVVVQCSVRRKLFKLECIFAVTTDTRDERDAFAANIIGCKRLKMIQ